MGVLKKFNKCFQIGFNKCGTTSLHKMFCDAGLKSIHWAGGHFASGINFNAKYDRKLLSNLASYDCYTDIENYWTQSYPLVSYFKLLDEQYENSIFIFNTRDVDKWITSRLNFGSLYIAASLELRANSKKRVAEIWKAQYYAHLENARDYFGDSDRFCEFRIETEGQKVEQFMKYWGVEGCEFKHLHKSK